MFGEQKRYHDRAAQADKANAQRKAEREAGNTKGTPNYQGRHRSS